MSTILNSARAKNVRIEYKALGKTEEEREFMKDLAAVGGVYGAKGAYLRTRLLAGYRMIMRQREALLQEADPMAALARLADSINAGHYHVLNTMLNVEINESAMRQMAVSAPAAAVVPAAPVVAQPQVAAVQPAVLTPAPPAVAFAPPEVVAAPAAVAAPAVSPTAEAMHVEAAAETLAESEVVMSEDDAGTDPSATLAQKLVEPPVAKPVMDWSGFSGIAGTSERGGM